MITSQRSRQTVATHPNSPQPHRPFTTWKKPIDQELATIQTWLFEARQHPRGSRDRDRLLTLIIRQVSPRLWRVATPYYADALQQTWVYFTQHLDNYDAERGSVVTWLNAYLKYRHFDLVYQAQQRQQREIPLLETGTDHIEFTVPVVVQVATKPYGSLAMLEEVRHWIATDAEGLLRRTQMASRPEVNAQLLLQHRLPPATPWREIAAQVNVPVSALSAFYRRQCLPLLRHFGESNGWL